MSTLFVIQPKDIDFENPFGVYTNYSNALLEAVKVELRAASTYGLTILTYTPNEEIKLDTFEEDDSYGIACVQRTVTFVGSINSIDDEKLPKLTNVVVTVANNFISTMHINFVTIINDVALYLGLQVKKLDPEEDDVNTVFVLSKD
jgi:hypothetical protein